MELGEIALAILAVILGAFFTSLFLVLREKKDIRRLVIRYVEVLIFIAPASLLLLLGDERIKTALLYLSENVLIISAVIPLVLYVCGFAVIAVMIFEVVRALSKEESKKKKKIIKTRQGKGEDGKK